MARRTIDFGIDLGTTNSEIAYLEKGEIRVFKNYKREEFTPSVVRIDEKGTIIVGRNAYKRLEDDPNNTVAEFKRWMGMQQIKEFLTSGKKMNAEELSAEVLKDLKVTAKSNLSNEEDISSAVITVPCNFEIVQCEATQRAAKLAGVKHAPLLQEPIAASIAYGFLEKMPKGYWIVFDLGGGTFDVAIMSAKDGRLSVVDHSGDNYLGGKDFDWKIVEEVIYPVLRQEYNLPELGRTAAYMALNAVLKNAAEEAKIELSAREKTDIVIHPLEIIKDKNGKTIDISVPIKRDQFNAIIEEFVEKSIQLFKRTLRSQNLSAADINQLILVGGPTQIPYIRNRLKDEFKIPTDYRIDPLTVVAQGAAVFAASQLIPEQLVQRDYSKAYIELMYNPMTIEMDTAVGGKIQPSNEAGILPDNMKVQISSINGDWQSGMIEVKNNAFFTKVTLREKRVNTFQIALLDNNGNKIVVDPDTFSINQGISVAEPPLIRSIGVELRDDSFSKHVLKGSSLPARSKPTTYRTARSVRPGEKEDVLNIHIREGESDIASRNRHLGTLKITGDMIKRPIPQDSEVEIIINVDKSRMVTAEAFIPLMQDQKFKEVIQNKISPKLEPDDILLNLEEEEVRLEKLKKDIGSTDDQSLDEKLLEAKIEERVNEIKKEVKAAKGGDPDAIEKADRRVKELKEVLDPIEYLTHWPSTLSRFNGIFSDCKEIVDSYGDVDDKDHLASLKKEADQAILSKDSKRLGKITDEMVALRWAVLFKQPGFWISAFQEIKKKPPVGFTNQTRADELMEEGSMALQRQDMDALKSIMFELWSLIPQEEQEIISERVSDSGIKKI